MSVTADPWAGLERAVEKRTRSQVNRPPRRELEEVFPESLLTRAAKRVVVVAGESRWIVKGDARLGDSYAGYTITMQEGRYRCSCEARAHGRKKLCSHVVAVIQRRREGLGTREGASPDSRGEGDAASGSPTGPTGAASPSASGPASSLVPDPRDPRFGTPGLPEWVREFRDHQWDAICETVEMFRAGREVVFLDAPTGSGKTLIGEVVRRELGGKATYVCHGLTLQDQFLNDFPYAAVLKGRSNYPTQWGGREVTAADCNAAPGDAESCSWCDARWDCPYERAKDAALRSPIAVVNTAYFLAESNHVGRLGEGRELVIADECDVLESELMGFIEFALGESTCRKLKVTPPAKGSHRKTIAAWMDEELQPAIEKRLRELPDTFTGMADLKVIREASSLGRMLGQVSMVKRQLTTEGWVRDNDAGPLVMKPVHVGWAGSGNLWQHGDRWLCMSATIVSPDEMAESLGLGDRDWGVVRVPMTFPVENRRIIAAPVANMVNAEKETAWPKMGHAIANVVRRHPGERVLVHAVSYALARSLVETLRRAGLGREVISYSFARERDRAVEKFRATPGAVMVAPSLDRGVDLKGDECRVVVVAKVPFPYLGDSQVSARANGPGGDQWYAVQTVRSLVQMTGRHVRSETDWGLTYVLDEQFIRNVWRKNKHLLPPWWREAVDTGFPTRELLG